MSEKSKPSFLERLFGRRKPHHPIDDSEPMGGDIRTSREPTEEELERVEHDKHTPGADTKVHKDR